MGIRKRKISGLQCGVIAVNIGSIAATSILDTPCVVNGLTPSHQVMVMCNGSLEAGVVIVAAWVPSANTLTIRAYNTTAAPIDPATQNYFYIAWIP